MVSGVLLSTGTVMLCAYACGVPSSVWAQPVQRHPPGVQVDLEQTLERIRAEYDLPSLAAAVVRGRSIQTAAVGVRRVGRSDVIQIADRFHIASCTKSMT